MGRHITIYGPKLGNKLLLMFESRTIEVKNSTLKLHFGINSPAITLHPLSLSMEEVKMEPVQGADGDDIYVLDHNMFQFYKVRECVDIAPADQRGSKVNPLTLEDGEENHLSVIDMIKNMLKESCT
ncbi:hypothetical protein GOP47_0013843 [Adiantum capillus-veneris]|uniref:Uncharacterized protein n=1 Tax=Adiantum capillus-veneris TaxID=13818 RepID=A0A9D4UQ94_ADICA|nr:hypothetical protein GOP47_0013843 [Adiantum capillus-veneris]